jgi:hypothetical protein
MRLLARLLKPKSLWKLKLKRKPQNNSTRL